ncbi:MAG: protein translocase subunit SecF [Candidatus Niyogibacteria bacterium]|nr:protein translocase subunit SecF [Candidatus Niyogibacteria bacterium]
MKIIAYRKFAYIFSGIVMIACLAAISVWGFRWGTDFTGGSLIEVKFLADRPSSDILASRLGDAFGKVSIQPTGEKNVILRARDLTEVEHQALLTQIAGIADHKTVLEEARFDSIGPVIGAELKRKSVTAIALVLVMIIIFITYAFWGVSHPVASWKYGVAAIVALAHDVIVSTGVFSVLGHYYGVEVDTLFVTALLTILGFSVHDTIVVFDRIRENLKRHGKQAYDEIVGESLHQTIGRSLATTFVVILVLAALFYYGAASTKYFALALIVGMTSGAYSSIFVASPLLVTWHKF